MNHILEVYKLDGTRYEQHHCDGTYDNDVLFLSALATVLVDPEVGGYRSIGQTKRSIH